MNEIDNNWSHLNAELIGGHVVKGTACSISGSGKVLVLIHGVGLDRALWDQHAEELSRDYCVIRLDLPGHGDSAPAPEGATIETFADQLIALLDHFQIERVAVAGYSLGALTTQSIINRYPHRLARVALLYSVYNRNAESRAAVAQRLAQAESEGTASLINNALARWFSPEFISNNPAVESKIRARLLNNNTEHFLTAYRIFVTSNVSVANTIDSHITPALVMTGELDPGSTPDMSKQIAADIPGSKLVVIQGARHMGIIEYFDDTIRHLRDWLAVDPKQN
ncbi:MAG: alpha/beta fold hydrolase [Pseudomonadota bacterium]